MLKYRIHSLGYDAEADELDLLINCDSPQSAESVEVDGGIYLRRDFETRQVVGAFIRGYRQFAQQVERGQLNVLPLAEKTNLRDVAQAIVEWQREVTHLSRELAAHLHEWPPQAQLLEAQIATA